MDINSELKVKKALGREIQSYLDTVEKANLLLNKAEGKLAEAVAKAYNAGMSVSGIAEVTGQNRHKIYLLLAIEGIRPTGTKSGKVKGN